MNDDDKQVEQALGLLGQESPAPPPIGDELARELDQMKPVAPRRPMRELAIFGALSLVYAACLLVILKFRADMMFLPRWWMVVYVACWALGFIGIGYLALVPTRGSVLPRWRSAGVAGIVAALLFITAGLLFARHHEPESILYEPTGSNIIRYGHYCLRAGLMTALVPIALATLLLRRTLPVGARWIAAAIGAAGGCLGGLMLHFHCNIAEPTHLGLIHGGVVLLGAVLCALILPRFLRP